VKIVVVGGVAAGASAATKARRSDETAEIIVFEKGPYVSFANCGLPYYVGGDIPRKENLLLVTPKLFKQRFNIDIRINHEVKDINPANKTVTVLSPDGEITESYDKLILATGSKPMDPGIPGIDLEGIFNVLTVPDVEGIMQKMDSGVESVVVMGGGFIGIETAEGFLKKGVKTTFIHRRTAVMKTYDPEFSVPLLKELQSMGLNLVLGKQAKCFEGKNKVEAVIMTDGTRVAADLVVTALGVRPQIELAEKAGLKIGHSGGVIVDEKMVTSDPNIYAAGDMVESTHLVTGEKVVIPLAGSANKQGRIAGNNAIGGNMTFKGVLGTSIIKVGELTLARTGLNEREAKESGKDFIVSYTSSPSHATYYPGARNMILKIIFEKGSGKLLGAQAAGYAGVDKRIDIIATALYGGMTVYDLEHLDLAYAPPYSSAKDPSIMAGMVGANILRGQLKIVSADELEAIKNDDSLVILDVRTPREHGNGAIEGSILLPVDQLREGYVQLDKNKRYVVYCKVGYRAYVACRFLMQQGYDVCSLSGGYDAYTMNVS